MLQALRKRRRNREIVDGLYEAIVERARATENFVEGGLPDTVMGRFESLSLEVLVFLDRCRADAALAPVAQDLVDRFMLDLDQSMRELGIGYQAVPKRMRRLAGQFYGRVDALKGPLEARDATALSAAIGRAVETDPEAEAADFLAARMLANAAELAAWPADEILAGRLPAIGHRREALDDAR